MGPALGRGGAERRTSVFAGGKSLGPGQFTCPGRSNPARRAPGGACPAGTDAPPAVQEKAIRYPGIPKRAQRSGSVGERRSKGAFEEWPPGCSEKSVLCDDAAMQDEAD